MSSSSKQAVPVSGGGDAPPTGPVADPTGGRSRTNPMQTVANLCRRSALLIFFVIAIVFFSVIKPNTFPTHATLVTIITAQTAPLMLALVVMMTLTLGDVDVSFAAVMIASSAVGGVLMSAHHVALLPAIVIMLAIGFVAGLVNGILVVVLRLPALIATLGTLSVAEGVALGVTHSQAVAGFPTALTTTLSGGPDGIPVGSIIVWGVFIGIWILFDYTPFGRYRSRAAWAEGHSGAAARVHAERGAICWRRHHSDGDDSGRGPVERHVVSTIAARRCLPRYDRVPDRQVQSVGNAGGDLHACGDHHGVGVAGCCGMGRRSVQRTRIDCRDPSRASVKSVLRRRGNAPVDRREKNEEATCTGHMSRVCWRAIRSTR
jgi:hypothetical protein